MFRALTITRYLVIIPIVGLVLAAAILFAFGGYSLIKLIIEATLAFFGLIEYHNDLPVYVEIVEYVHMFLIGTVLYITAAGFFQLFVKKLDFPYWLRIESVEELETNLIGVTVVVLAVNFMAFAFTKQVDYIFKYGAGIAMPIAALSLFLGTRAWVEKRGGERKETEREKREE